MRCKHKRFAEHCPHCREETSLPPSCSPTPAHYDKPIQPWDLERCMESSGNAFVDARRTDAIEYCFRIKGDLLGDLRKARHCIDAAIEVLSANAEAERP